MKQWSAVHALIAVVGLVLAVEGAVATPTGVALVVHVEGDTELARGKEQWPLRRYDVLTRGDVLHLAPAAQVALMYPGTRQLWTVRGDRRTRVRIEAKSPVALERAVLERRELHTAYSEVKLDAAVFAQAALVLRSEAPQPQFRATHDALWLSGDVAVEWLPVPRRSPPDAPDAAPTVYRVQLIDSERVVVESREVTTDRVSWSALRPGAYLVQVSFTDAQARVRGNTLRFTVATSERVQRLNAAQPATDASAAERAAYDALRLYFTAQP